MLRLSSAKFLSNRRGNLAMLTALMLPVLLGTTGLITDTVESVMFKREMQRQADSGAMAGAFALAQQKSVSTSVNLDLTRNANRTLTIAPVIQQPPASGSYAGSVKAVRVVLATDVDLPFTHMITRASRRISAEATAALISQGEYCVLALESTAVTGITMTGNASVTLGCGMATNSPANDAVTASGSSAIIATPIAAVGGLQPSSNYLSPTTLQPYSIPVADPYANLPDPAISNGSGKVNVQPSKIQSFSPGTYKGMDIQGTATFAPGIYYIDGGQFSVGAQGVVIGTGVTIVLTSATAAGNPSSIATVDMNGGATLSITAPTSGTYKGVLFYQDRRALDGNNKVNGNATSKLEGALYFPKQGIEFSGNSSADVKCLQVVGRRVTFTGNSNILNVCPAGSGSFKGTRVKLVA